MYATKLSVMLLDENVSTRDAAELIRLDPSLVSMILKRVNSAYYGFQGKISDFQHAVLILGFINVYQLVMDVGVRSTMPKTSEFNELQFHSMVVSIVSHQLSELCKVENAAVSSTIGLLHDIGKSVILLLQRRHPKMALFIDMLDHSKVGSILLKEWNIPELVCKSLEYQAHPELLPPGNIPEELRESVAVLYISHLCYEYLLGRKESELPTSFLPEYMGLLNRPERSISELVDKQVFPSLSQRWNALPDNVRQFLKRSQDTVGAKANEDA
jgi:HD-like signal output (HDOD) protein